MASWRSIGLRHQIIGFCTAETDFNICRLYIFQTVIRSLIDPSFPEGLQHFQHSHAAVVVHACKACQLPIQKCSDRSNWINDSGIIQALCAGTGALYTKIYRRSIDQQIVLDGLKKQLNWSRFNGLICGCVSDGAEAINFLQTCRPDVIISDIKMPHMDGIN